jgi:glycosyltransferase 2 family protein
MSALNGTTAANQPTNSKIKRGWVFLLLRWAAGLLVLALLAHFLPVAQLRSALSRVPPARFVSMLIIYFFAVLGGITKWHLVVNSAGARLPFSVSTQCYTGGLFGALFLPSIVGGDAVRLAVGIGRSSRPAAVITGNIADRILDVAAQLTLVLLGLSFLPGALPESFRASARHVLMAAFFLLLVLCLLCLVVLPSILRGRSIRVRRRLLRVRQAMRAVSLHPFRLLFCWMLGTAVQCTYLLITALLGISCGLYLPLRIWLFAWPLSKLAAVLPITQGGIGVREAALVVLLKPFGAPGAQVLATGIAAEGIVIAGGLLAGLTALVLRTTMRDRKLSH